MTSTALSPPQPEDDLLYEGDDAMAPSESTVKNNNNNEELENSDQMKDSENDKNMEDKPKARARRTNPDILAKQIQRITRNSNMMGMNEEKPKYSDFSDLTDPSLLEVEKHLRKVIKYNSTLSQTRRRIRPEAMFTVGVSQLSTEDIMNYFRTLNPIKIEWIDDNSCNVVWAQSDDCLKALLKISKEQEVEVFEETEKETLEKSMSENMDENKENSNHEEKDSDAEKDKIAMPPPVITPGRKVALPTNKNQFTNVLRDCMVPLIKVNRAYHLEVRLAVNSDKKVNNTLARNRVYGDLTRSPRKPRQIEQQSRISHLPPSLRARIGHNPEPLPEEANYGKRQRLVQSADQYEDIDSEPIYNDTIIPLDKRTLNEIKRELMAISRGSLHDIGTMVADQVDMDRMSSTKLRALEKKHGKDAIRQAIERDQVKRESSATRHKSGVKARLGKKIKPSGLTVSVPNEESKYKIRKLKSVKKPFIGGDFEEIGMDLGDEEDEMASSESSSDDDSSDGDSSSSSSGDSDDSDDTIALQSAVNSMTSHMASLASSQLTGTSAASSDLTQLNNLTPVQLQQLQLQAHFSAQYQVALAGAQQAAATNKVFVNPNYLKNKETTTDTESTGLDSFRSSRDARKEKEYQKELDRIERELEDRKQAKTYKSSDRDRRSNRDYSRDQDYHRSDNRSDRREDYYNSSDRYRSSRTHEERYDRERGERNDGRNDRYATSRYDREQYRESRRSDYNNYDDRRDRYRESNRDNHGYSTSRRDGDRYEAREDERDRRAYREKAYRSSREEEKRVEKDDRHNTVTDTSSHYDTVTETEGQTATEQENNNSDSSSSSDTESDITESEAESVVKNPNAADE